ncbi:MAG: putative DNA binding domain-containing protein [Acidobacteria bacterium]|nr:putative DNA binding domain-containing protein [Acidobacteriota bacterium]
MSLGSIHPSALTFDHIQSLLEAQEPESRTLEYKRSISTNTGDEKREFLKDVASFANASGGYILYGVDESQGVPTSFPGVELSNPDASQLAIENLIRDGIAPRLRVVVRRFDINGGRHLLAIHIPASWQRPYLVTHGGAGRFYAFTRTGPGKQPLDVPDLRNAFLLSESAAERVRRFRAERISAILARETPVLLHRNSCIVLHLIPIHPHPFDHNLLSRLDLTGGQIRPLRLRQQIGSVRGRYNLDGYSSQALISGGAPSSYLQVFRDGAIESADSSLFIHPPGRSHAIPKPPNTLPRQTLEPTLLVETERLLRLQETLDVQLPIALSVSLLNVKGWCLWGGSNAHGDMSEPVDRDLLLLPDVLVTEGPPSRVDLSALMKPVFDALWNAVGEAKSPHYDASGHWSLPR